MRLMDDVPAARGAGLGRNFLPHDAGWRCEILLPARLVRCRGSNDTARTGAWSEALWRLADAPSQTFVSAHAQI